MRASFLFLVPALFVGIGCSGSSSSDVLGPSSSSSSSGGTSTSKDDTTPPEPSAPGDSTDPAKDDPADTTKPPTTSSPPATAAECDAFAAKFCPKADACNHLVSKLLGADCADRVAGICKARLSAPGTGFTSAALTACGNAYSTMTCDQAFGAVQPAACNFKGTLASNTECAFADQCASGYCSGGGDNECGKCAPNPVKPPVALAELGEDCDNAGQAAPQCNTSRGLWCDSGTKKCADIALAGIGQSCGFVGDDLVMCGPGGTCNYGSSGSGTCVAQKAIGASCSAASGYEECAFGTTCLGGKCVYPTAAAICQ